MTRPPAKPNAQARPARPTPSGKPSFRVKTSPAGAKRPVGPPSVAVVGGGLAGMTSALRLLQRGFAVTLYEASDILGGNLSSEKVNGVYHDVYPHMFPDWYANFWQIFEQDLGLVRNDHFEPREGVKILEHGKKDFVELENATTLKSVFNNLASGVASWPDMFLLGFSMLDLAAHPFDRTSNDMFNRLDVNGFIYSRGYATEAVARLQNYFLMVIWSIQSDQTSAASYQDFIKHTLAFPHPTPFCWLPRGSSYEKVIQPLETKLRQLGCDIRLGAEVSRAELVDRRPRLVVETRAPAGAPTGARGKSVRKVVSLDYAVLALPGIKLAELVMAGDSGRRLVDHRPSLSALRRFYGETIPVVDIYFTKKLPGIPREQVGLRGSGCEVTGECDLTFVDISQLWTGDPALVERTALVVAASDDYLLPASLPREKGFLMIKALHDYLPVFEPGKHWGDPHSDIDWEKTHFRSNAEHLLFIDDVGSWQWRPVAAYPEELPSVFFAGDYCQTDVDMATMEAAVQSGIQAAAAVRDADAKAAGAARGDPITAVSHEVYSDATFLAAKLALLPMAYAATAWSAVVEARQHKTKAPLGANAYSPETYSLLLPLAFTLDWWKTAYWLARRLAPGGDGPPGGLAVERGRSRSPVPGALGGRALALAGEALRALLALRQPEGEARDLRSAAATFAGQLVKTLAAAPGLVAPTTDGLAQVAWRRRWRVKD